MDTYRADEISFNTEWLGGYFEDRHIPWWLVKNDYLYLNYIDMDTCSLQAKMYSCIYNIGYR